MNEVLSVLPEFSWVVVKPRARDYLVDGVRYQRVTTALGIINKPALIPWAKRTTLAKVGETLLDPVVRGELLVALEESPGEYEGFVERLLTRAGKATDEVRDESAGRGTAIHALVQEALFSPESAEEEPAIHSARAFITEYGITVCDLERVVWDDFHAIAGTIDGVGWRGDKLVIWDWKTGSHLYWEAALQLAAYAFCLERLTGVEVHEAFGVRLPQEGGAPEVKRGGRVELLAAMLPYFAALSLYRAGSDKLWSEEEEEDA